MEPCISGGATPRHEIEFAAGKLPTPGNLDRRSRRSPPEKRVPSGHSQRARLRLGTPHRPKLPFTAVSICCPEPRCRAFAPAPHGRRITDLEQDDEAMAGMVFGPIPPFGELMASIVRREQRLAPGATILLLVLSLKKKPLPLRSFDRRGPLYGSPVAETRPQLAGSEKPSARN